jgi:hypothetical protein
MARISSGRKAKLRFGAYGTCPMNLKTLIERTHDLSTAGIVFLIAVLALAVAWKALDIVSKRKGP